MKSREFRDNVAKTFADSLRADPLKWSKDWFSARSPFNGTNDKSYRGINRLWLSYCQRKSGYSDNRWMTYKQAQKNGMQVRKGEKGSNVIYWSPYDPEKKKTISWEDAKNTENLKVICRTFTVFNGSQIDGMPTHPDDAKKHWDIEEDDRLGKMAKGMGVTIEHNPSASSPVYYPMFNTIVTPPPEHFQSQEAYESATLHELAHATNKPLNREMGKKFGDSGYAREELVAEITACYMCNEFGIEMDESHFQNHVAYVQGWANAVEKDPQVLESAVKDAEKASDYLMVKAGIMSQSEYDRRHRDYLKKDESKPENPETKEEEPETKENNPETKEEEPKAGEVNDKGEIWVSSYTRNGRTVKGHWRKRHKR